MASSEIEMYPLPARVRETINIDEPDDERIALLVSPGERLRPPPRARSRYTIMCLILLIVLTIAISVALGVTLSAGSEASAEQTGGCSAATYRFDCYTEGDGNEAACASRGCCWNSSVSPSCFYPDRFGYSMDGALSFESYGHGSATLSRKANQPVQYTKPVAKLRVDVYLETQYRLRVKISDPSTNRYEVPWPPRPIVSNASNTLYKVTTGSETFNFTVSRADTGLPIFSTGTGFIFEDQLLQISALLPTSNIYGLGEHTTRLRLPTNITLTMFSHDTPPLPSEPTENLNGVHPFYLGLEQDGRAHGVFLLNSNAMEVQLQPYPSITYRTIGGVLDFYFFLGPGPDQVIQQYTELIGRPYLPPYWSLGFHLSRWGYMTANNTLTVVERMRQKRIPQDTQWNDIDYMNMDLDFTYSAGFGDIQGLVSDLHSHSQRYVLIVDPAISNQQLPGQYSPFDSGLSLNIFITNSSGQLLIGKVWPNSTTVWPDFTHPNVDQYWTSQISQFHSNVSFDGLWIDMNEPSNFVDGSMDGCPISSLEVPPFVPKAIRSPLGHKVTSGTLCMTANQYLSTHYNLHNLYGLTEANSTMNALTATLNKRSLVISRSTYPGSGAQGGHWLGDNASEWPDLAISIPGILQFSLFGIPLVGADICGFNGNTTQELCTRWQQLGAFYPFSRNHNSLDSIDQDPAVFDDASIDSSRDALMLRYSLLPYLYTLFYFAHTTGSTVARPLFFEFPTDSNTWDLDTQFLWGSSLLISPVLTENVTSVEAYFPHGRWFNFTDGQELSFPGQSLLLHAPYNFIPLHVRGGSVIPMQTPNTTTTQSRLNSFQLLIAPDGNQNASGYLYLDDGESLNTDQTNNYTLLQFALRNNVFSSIVLSSGYGGADGAVLESIKTFGIKIKPTNVYLNTTAIGSDNFTYSKRVNRYFCRSETILFYGRGGLVLAMGAMWVVVAAARVAAGEVVVGALVPILVPVVGLVQVAAVLLLLLLEVGAALLLVVGTALLLVAVGAALLGRGSATAAAGGGRLHVDFAGPFLGKQFIILVDASTKWLEFFPPMAFRTFLSPTFSSSEFEEFVKRNGFRHIRVAPYHPASNGAAERAVQTLKEYLSKTRGDLETRLSRFLFQYRLTPHTSTGLSPAELLFGRRPKSHLDFIHPDLSARVTLQQERQHLASESGASIRAFLSGDKVYVRNFSPSTSSSVKWLPGVVTSLAGPRSVRVALEDGTVVRRHFDHVKFRVLPPPHPDQSSTVSTAGPSAQGLETSTTCTSGNSPDAKVSKPLSAPVPTPAQLPKIRRSSRIKNAPQRF
ncbi:hypothetical protein EMCRGX_G000670 [Ephydatia muelleri]